MIAPLALAGAARSQIKLDPTPGALQHGPGMLVTLDADGDAFADFLVAGPLGAWLYHGSPVLPFYGPIPTTVPWVGPGVTCAPPVFDGQDLYVPMLDPASGAGFGRIEVLSRASGFQTVVATWVFPSTSPGQSQVNALRLVRQTGLGVLAVVGETQNGGVGRNQLWNVRASAAQLVRRLPPVPGQPASAFVADAVRFRSALAATDEVMIVLSSGPEVPYAGFGVQHWASGASSGQVSGQWWWGPGLRGGGRDPVRSPVLCLPPDAVFPVSQLLLKTHDYGTGQPFDGALVLLTPSTVPPYVQAITAPLSAQGWDGFFLPTAGADYDGNGGLDAVYASGATVTVFDAEVTRAFSWHVDYRRWRRGGSGHADFGTAGDFDGDGATDLLVLLWHDPVVGGQISGDLSFVKGTGQAAAPFQVVY